MTDYEIIMVFLGILALLISSGSLIIALLTFLDKRNKRKNNAYPVWPPQPVQYSGQFLSFIWIQVRICVQRRFYRFIFQSRRYFQHIKSHFNKHTFCRPELELQSYSPDFTCALYSTDHGSASCIPAGYLRRRLYGICQKKAEIRGNRKRAGRNMDAAGECGGSKFTKT